jgi:ATP-binding cassette subfamily B protein
MFLSSIVEIISIGMVLPFLAALSDPNRIFIIPFVQPLVQELELKNSNQLLLIITAIFLVIVIISGMVRLVLLWVVTRFSYAAGVDISLNIYRRTLYQPYSVHVSRNSSEIINGIASKSGNAIYVINTALLFLSSILMITAVFLTLLLVEPEIAFATFGGFGFIYAFVMLITRKKQLLNSQIVARESTKVIKCLQEGLGGIRDVLIDGSQATYCKIYRDADQSLRFAEGNKLFISTCPRAGVETLGMLFIAGLAYSLAQQPDGLQKALPFLGAFALGSQRLLPALQQAYSSWSGILGSQASLEDTLDLLDQKLPDYIDNENHKPLTFNHKISLKEISFRYNEHSQWVLSDLNLVISKGTRVGFIGNTGAGKSTLIDIIMGLLQPTTGKLEIDGELITTLNQRAWQVHIAHVPQSIYLADCSISENIALGVPNNEIDMDRVKEAAKRAQISSVIETWNKKYETVVGERGMRLSGGQRQRIGIARALYKKSDVIIFDEATSALDSETENEVMKALEDLDSDMTVLIIAHRLTTLKNCDQIIQLGSGGVQRSGTYEDVVSQDFRISK